MLDVWRREFITLLGGAAVWPLAARAQPVRVRQVGVLMGTGNDSEGRSRIAALLKGLADLGWSESKNVHIEVRYAANDAKLIEAYSKELVGLAPDVIIANSTPVMTILKGHAGRIPVVFVTVADPVGLGFVTSIAHPGGNITGFTYYEAEMAGKWLGLLKEIAPRISRVMAILNPTNPAWQKFMGAIEAGAAKLGVQSIPAGVGDAAEIEIAFDTFAREPNGGVIAFQDNLTVVHRELIVSLANRHRLPLITPYSLAVKSGALLSYGIDNSDLYRRAASYADRILRGENPGELPVQAPVKFELLINLKTARTLGLDVPPTLLVLADEVIE
jgi:putative ABC transport system substrate-binding protein